MSAPGHAPKDRWYQSDVVMAALVTSVLTGIFTLVAGFLFGRSTPVLAGIIAQPTSTTTYTKAGVPVTITPVPSVVEVTETETNTVTVRPGSSPALDPPSAGPAYHVSLAELANKTLQDVDDQGRLFYYALTSGTCGEFDGGCSQDFTLAKLGPTTCSTLLIKAVYLPYQGESGSVLHLSVDQASRGPYRTTVEPYRELDHAVPLDGGPLEIHIQGTPTNQGHGGYIYLNGTAGCDSPNGQ